LRHDEYDRLLGTLRRITDHLTTKERSNGERVG
jgi:hypothetical protein